MKKTFSLAKMLLGLTLMGTSLVSCSDFDWDSTKDEFSTNFIKNYGEVDPENDFNTADSFTAAVTINYEGNYTFEVYTADPYEHPELSYLVARYRNLEGGGQSYELLVDAPSMFKGLYTCLVSDDGGRIVKGANIDKDGVFSVVFGTEDASDTRAFSLGNSNTYWWTSDYATFGMEYLAAILDNMPEGHNTTSNNDYELSSNGPFTVYPIYSVTSGQDEVGYYYYDPTKETRADAHLVPFIDLAKAQYDGTYEHYMAKNTEISNYWGNSNYASDRANLGSKWGTEGYRDIYAKGITINVPPGYRVGFYIKNRAYGEDGHKSYTSDGYAAANTFFSAQALNDNNSYSAFYKNPTMFLVGLEDWKLSEDGLSRTNGGTGGDNDCNDIIFSVVAENSPVPDVIRLEEITNTIIETETTTTVTNTSIGYLIAFEDLGDTDDSDFNDIVLRVNHVSGEENASVELLCAGGTLETTMHYGETSLWNGTEVHDLYGVELKEMVNTGLQTKPNPSKFEFYVGKDFKIKEGAKNFYIRVKQKDEKIYTDVRVPQASGSTPQAILIADPNWTWPRERQKIGDAYPDFLQFVANYKENDWYNVTWTGNDKNVAYLGEEATESTTTTTTIERSETTYITVDQGGNADQFILLNNGLNDIISYRTGDGSWKNYTFKYKTPEGYQVLQATLNVIQTQAGTVTLTSPNNASVNCLLWSLDSNGEWTYGGSDKSLYQTLRWVGTNNDQYDYYRTMQNSKGEGVFTISLEKEKILSGVYLDAWLKKIDGVVADQTLVLNPGGNDLTESRQQCKQNKNTAGAETGIGYRFHFKAPEGYELVSADIEVVLENNQETPIRIYKHDGTYGNGILATLSKSGETVAWSSKMGKNAAGDFGFSVYLPERDNITEIKSVRLVNTVLNDLRSEWRLDFNALALASASQQLNGTFTVNGVVYNKYKFNDVAYNNFGVVTDTNWYLRTAYGGGLYGQNNGNRNFAIKAYSGQFIHVDANNLSSLTVVGGAVELQSKYSTDNNRWYKVTETVDNAVVFSIERYMTLYEVGVANEMPTETEVAVKDVKTETAIPATAFENAVNGFRLQIQSTAGGFWFNLYDHSDWNNYHGDGWSVAKARTDAIVVITDANVIKAAKEGNLYITHNGSDVNIKVISW